MQKKKLNEILKEGKDQDLCQLKDFKISDLNEKSVSSCSSEDKQPTRLLNPSI